MAAPQERETSKEDNGEIDSDDICLSGDSDEDPTFDILEETRSRFSNISIKKSRPRKMKEMDSESEVGEVGFGVEIPELDEKDGICFEKVEKLIEDGHLEKLKVDQCKVYLRKYGLRLTGKKSILLERIREHLEVINGGGERKYPASSFVLNCKGDACTGDVVMFEQKVYDMFSIASRSATGPPIGTRIVAGRIVKESYGAAKQQHTFTIEVLWSKGEKALPPLHPLLIKGRNLYRLQTVRQRWANEEERRKALQEKHQRGSIARCSREIRIENKEMRKMGIRIAENKGKQQHLTPTQTKIAQPESIQHPTQLQNLQKDTKRDCAHHFQNKSDMLLIAEQHNNRMTDNKGKQQPANPTQTRTFQQENIRLPQQLQNHQKDMLLIAEQRNSSFQVSKLHESEFKPDVHNPRILKPWNYELNSHLHENPSIGAQQHNTAQVSKARSHGFQNPPRPHLRDNHQQYQPHPHWSNPHNLYHREQQPNTNHYKQEYVQPRQQEYVQPRQRCRFFRQGRCYYGDHCKYLHD